jgi:hypothetical protein
MEPDIVTEVFVLDEALGEAPAAAESDCSSVLPPKAGAGEGGTLQKE